MSKTAHSCTSLSATTCFQLLVKDPSTRLGCSAPDGSNAASVKLAQFFHSINFAQLEAGILDPPFTPDVSHWCYHHTFFIPFGN